MAVQRGKNPRSTACQFNLYYKKNLYLRYAANSLGIKLANKVEVFLNFRFCIVYRIHGVIVQNSSGALVASCSNKWLITHTAAISYRRRATKSSNS